MKYFITKILNFMKKDNHIDPDLYQFIIDEGLLKEYAETELNPDQCDIV